MARGIKRRLIPFLLRAFAVAVLTAVVGFELLATAASSPFPHHFTFHKLHKKYWVEKPAAHPPQCFTADSKHGNSCSNTVSELKGNLRFALAASSAICNATSWILNSTPSFLLYRPEIQPLHLRARENAAVPAAPPTFGAIEFETADDGRDSACALALVRVEAGVIVQRAFHYIRPPRQRMLFTSLHGISWGQVAGAPRFTQPWPLLQTL